MSMDVIIPCTVATPSLWYAAQVAIRTCRSSTSARVHAICNNSPDENLRHSFKSDCEALGVEYRYWDEKWNMNRCFNMGMDITVGDYVAVSNQDVIFYPEWFENIVHLWKKNPEYFVLIPWSQSSTALTAFCKITPSDTDEIRECHDVTSGVTVFRRSNGYRYDERFADLEQDTDLQYYCQFNHLKRGVVLNARVDHLFCMVRNSIDMSQATGIDNQAGKAKVMLKEKWGLREPGV